MPSATDARRPDRVANKFIVGRKLGAGSFGEIFQGTDSLTGAQVAIKMEQAHTRHPQLLYEAAQYRRLNASGSKVGFPRLHWHGCEGDWNVMVIDLLGPSLEEIFSFCGRRLSLLTVLVLGDQMLSRVEHMHRNGLLHRDIKPDNFLMGRGPRGHIVHAIDLGLSKKFRSERPPYRHIPFKDGKNLTGTARYASINTHKGQEQSRRDDLESIGYVMLYLLRGGLPWQNLRGVTKKEKYDLISARKQSTSLGSLCRDAENSPLPEEFRRYLSYVRELGFEEEPDYEMLRGLLRGLYVRHADGRPPDFRYDWLAHKKKVTAELRARGALPEDYDGPEKQRRRSQQ